MATDKPGTRLRVDSDGVKIETSGVRTGVWVVLLAVVLVGGAVVALRPIRETNREEVARAHGDAVVDRRDMPLAQAPAKPLPMQPAGHAAVPTAAIHDAEATPPNDDADAVAAATPGDETGATTAEGEVSEAPMFGPITPGEKTGVALFPPPGTKPIKRGILVPEDFELPPGYVRHYQATDDGQRVPAILMFHPDYQPLDEHGVPIPLPPNRVVPPEMAPPGLPIQMLELPENQGEQGAVP